MSRAAILAGLKEKLASGELVLGMQHSSGSGAVIELLGLAGWNFAIVDMEHSSTTIAVVEELVRAAEAVDLAAFVRVLRNDEKLIMQALDAGAVGVLVPHVLDADGCTRAIRAARFPPLGIRGKTASSRAAGWGLGAWTEYEQWANTEPLVIPIVEDPEGVEAITGAKMASSTIRQMTAKEPTATRSRRSRAQASCHGLRPSMLAASVAGTGSVAVPALKAGMEVTLTPLCSSAPALRSRPAGSGTRRSGRRCCRS